MKQATWIATNGIVAKYASRGGKNRGHQQDDHEQVLAHFTGQK